jgi:hypothetical protein
VAACLTYASLALSATVLISRVDGKDSLDMLKNQIVEL